MTKVFDTRKHIVSRGKVYNRITRRWEGDLADFDDLSVPEEALPAGEVAATPPAVEDMTKAQLIDAARERDIVGFSSMSKGELKTALLGTGDVADGEEAG